MILALVLGGMLSAQAQHVQESKFCSPFDFPILLSANFGELRPNHFHNGLDIKTQGVTGKPIHCIADGYVSRVAVLHGGYGQAIYVTHPNGLTSVYGHVISFAKNIQACVRQYQYAHETFVCDLKFQPGQFPVKKGDIIALSGNEGASAGPHLHLELRRTETGEYIDPMPYFKHLLKDSKAPVGSLIGIYPIQGKGVVNGTSHKKLLAIGNLKQPVHAWGEIYTGISAKDYMDGTSNFYGVHSVTLYVDSVQVFNSTTDKVLPDENRMINGFTDYEELTRTRRLIMRSYKLPGNRLRLLHTNENRGAVTIDEERDYHFRYVLEDNFGNRRTYQFIVKGKRQDIPEYKPEANEMLYWNRTNVIQKPGMELVVPRYHVYENVPLRTDRLHTGCRTDTHPQLLRLVHRPAPHARGRHHEILHRAESRKMAKLHGRKIRQRMDKDARTLTRHLLCGRGYHCPANHSYRSGRMAHQPKYPFPDKGYGIGHRKLQGIHRRQVRIVWPEKRHFSDSGPGESKERGTAQTGSDGDRPMRKYGTQGIQILKPPFIFKS